MKYLRYFSLAYIAVLVIAFVSLFFLNSESMGIGCYITDKFVIGAMCEGFREAEVVQFILNMPLLLLYAPLLGMLGLFEGPSRLHYVYLLLMGIALWLPIVFLLWDIRRRKFRGTA
jgi:hypothetical protein